MELIGTLVESGRARRDGEWCGRRSWVRWEVMSAGMRGWFAGLVPWVGEREV